MLNNYLFFLFDRLNITKSERFAIVSITTLIVLVSLMATLVRRDIPFPDEHYAFADSLFTALSQQRTAERAELMARYDPPSMDNTKPDSALDPRNTRQTSTRAKTAASAKSSKLPAPESINLNTANANELGQLPGIGPKTAEAIITYRQTNGPFQELAHITRVKGIGSKKWEQIRPYLRL